MNRLDRKGLNFIQQIILLALRDIRAKYHERRGGGVREGLGRERERDGKRGGTREGYGGVAKTD